jgi:hypothetical protein
VLQRDGGTRGNKIEIPGTARLEVEMTVDNCDI